MIDIGKQYPSADGCIYFLNIKQNKIQKICDVDEIPKDVVDLIAVDEKAAQAMVAEIKAFKDAMK